MATHPQIRIGTRASPLARAQAEAVRAALLAADPALSPESITLVPMTTAGDKQQEGMLAAWGYKGLFTRELEEALLAGTIDLAVHSMKDVPSVSHEALLIAAMLPREDARDAFIAQGTPNFDALPQGATVGTSSVRRAAQIRALRPDLTIVPLRGNVGTRLDKLARGEAQATFLAMAGLKRLQMEQVITEPMEPARMLPAIAQGAIGIECRRDDGALHELLARINHAATFTAVAAERAVLRVLDGTCRTPVAGYAVLDGTYVHLKAMVIAPDGSESVSREVMGPHADADALGVALGHYLKELGGHLIAG
jgi:hydroxymethylbilane synthase